MKFFHVYNEECFKGLEKNGLINQDTGFKIQHAFSVPQKLKFNQFAAKGGALYQMIKEGNHPFYVDRIAGGVTYYPYSFDRELIKEYSDLLGDWFLGFQLHESGSNRRRSDWKSILRKMDGNRGPYDLEQMEKKFLSTYARNDDGNFLFSFSQDNPKKYAAMRYAETPAEYIEEMKDMFRRRMEDVDGKILPCDSYYQAAKLQDEMGMKSFMPEVGSQIPMMRQEVALVRGIAKASHKTWGTYYECWRAGVEDGVVTYTMPCFNSDPSNEWYLTQDIHPDDFTSCGENGGSSRLLQNRIYYYTLMSGADYMAEEWGLNCSYSDMNDFTLSAYGNVKKNFINKALTLRGIRAKVPFAIVLPKAYGCMEIPEEFVKFHAMYQVGVHKDLYLESPLSQEEKEYIGHVEDVLKLFFAQLKEIGNEGHVITNSRFGDLFDIIYEDASDEALEKYAYLIDATPDGSFLKAKGNEKSNILESKDLEKLAYEVDKLGREVMPCYVDQLCWLVSEDEEGARYLSIFNNEGNERSLTKGDIIHKEANTTVEIKFKEAVNLQVVVGSAERVDIQKADDYTYHVEVPAAGFVIFRF